MRQKKWKKGMAVLMAGLLSLQAPFVIPAPFRQAYAYTERPAMTNASSLNVRSGPGTSYSRVASLGKGTSITVINEVIGSDGKRWYQIRFSGGTGYALGTYIRFPVTYNQDSNFEAYLTSQGFPESYKTGLRQLHAQYPNWVFEAQQTGLDWNTVIQNENIIPRSLIHKNSISSHKSVADGAYNWDNGTWTGFDGSTWVAASEDIIRYYMDPRNFLDDVYIFQFMSHGYDASTQTREGLQSLVRGTFLDGSTTGGGWENWNNNGSSATGPGGTASQGNHSGVVTSPGTSGGSKGPGVSGGGGGSSGENRGGSQDSEVHLRGPQVSLSRHKVSRVAATVRVGVKPGQDAQGGNPSQGGTSLSPGSSSQGGTSSSPGSSSQGGTSPSPGNPSQGGTSSPVVSPGGTQSGTQPSPGNPSQGGSTQQFPGGGSQTGSLGGSGGGNTNIPYVDIIMQAASASGVNPYVLTAMILQEQGSDGRGNSISGTNSAYPGYYNYFNVGAYAADGMGPVERGLWYASQTGNYGRPWNTPEKSIIGGAQFYGDNYVRAGQDTFYLKKYNVQGNNLYKHQYMTNVDGAASEGSIFAESYSDTLKSMPLRFKIPVYTGMPDIPCAKPTGDGSPNNKLSSLGANGFSLTPTFHRDTYSYNLIVDGSVSTISIYANAIDNTASVSGTGNFQLSDGTNEIRVRVKAQNGSERDYVIHVVRQNGGASYNGNNNPAGSGQPQPANGPGVSDSPKGGQPGSAPTPGGSNVIVISP